jgi:hypothetical protein
MNRAKINIIIIRRKYSLKSKYSLILNNWNLNCFAHFSSLQGFVVCSGFLSNCFSHPCQLTQFLFNRLLARAVAWNGGSPFKNMIIYKSTINSLQWRSPFWWVVISIFKVKCLPRKIFDELCLRLTAFAGGGGGWNIQFSGESGHLYYAFSDSLKRW